MNAQARFERMSADEFRDWFQAQVSKLHDAPAEQPLSMAIGATFRHAIEVCASEDCLPAWTREELKAIGESVLFPESVEEPCTYAEGATLLRECLERQARVYFLRRERAPCPKQRRPRTSDN